MAKRHVQSIFDIHIVWIESMHNITILTAFWVYQDVHVITGEKPSRSAKPTLIDQLIWTIVTIG